MLSLFWMAINIIVILQLLIYIYLVIHWYYIHNWLLLLQNHPGSFHWEDELLQNLPPRSSQQGWVHWEDELLENTSTPSADVLKLGVHGNSGVLGSRWLKNAMRCCVGSIVCCLCYLGVLLLLVLLFTWIASCWHCINGNQLFVFYD